MKMKIVLIMMLGAFCFFSANAQWQKVANLGANAGGPRPFCTFKSNILLRTSLGTHLSTDTGKTWKLVDSSEAMKYAFFVANDSLIFASCYLYGVYVSSDSGKTWKRSGDLPTKVMVNNIVVNGPHIIVTTGYDSIYVSKDNGLHWFPSNNGLKKPSDPSSVLYGLLNLDNKTFICYGLTTFVTYDNGLSWHHFADSSPISYPIVTLGYNIISAHLNKIFISGDSTLHWKYVATLGSDAIYQFAKNGVILMAAAGDDGGVEVSKDSGQTWFAMKDGLPGTQVMGVAILGDYAVAGVRQGQIYRRSLSEITGMKGKYETNLYSQEILKVKIYPNPFKNTAIVEFGRGLHNGVFHIYTMKGQEINSIQNINSDRIELQKGKLASGMYIYTVTEGNEKIAVGKIEIE